MILYKLKKNNNETIKGAYGKYYPLPVITQTIDLSGLADHMAEHNTGFSHGAVKGLLTDMVRCIKELVLKGIAVKIDDLAIFSIGIRTKKGADNEKDFSVAKNIEGVKLRARATGSLTSNNLDILATLKNAATLLGSDESTTDDSDPTTDPSDDNKGDKDQEQNKGDNADQGGGSSSGTGGSDQGGNSPGSEGDDDKTQLD